MTRCQIFGHCESGTDFQVVYSLPLDGRKIDLQSLEPMSHFTRSQTRLCSLALSLSRCLGALDPAAVFETFLFFKSQTEHI